MVIEPRHPFERGEFHRFHGFPGGTPMNQFGFVEAVDGFGERIIVAVTLAADGRLDAGFSQTLGVPDANVLRAPVAMMNECGVPIGLARMERLLQGIQHEVGVHRTAHPPADNAPGIDIDDESDVHPALPQGIESRFPPSFMLRHDQDSI